MNKKTIFLGLNELNLNFIKDYVERGYLPSFKKLLSENKIIETLSEKKYEELEPWIQWVTISTGLTYEEHKVFRLGDIVDRKDLKQIYEKIEEKGFTVAAISPFNVENRLKKPSFFVSDPWTGTKNSGSSLLQSLGEAVSQAVNDNANGKLKLKSILALLVGLAYYPQLKSFPSYLKRILQIRKKGTKAIILDKLLGDIFLKEWKKHQPDFSHLFLNTGAHIQHHYMFNSAAYKGHLKNPDWYCPHDEDPLLEVLIEYDNVLSKLMALPVRLIIATGLHQVPHQYLTYYWRLKNHANFLEMCGVKKIIKIHPRMSRDFLIEFNLESDALEAVQVLNSYELNNERVFTIDNRGKSLFVELVYPNEIFENSTLLGMKTVENFKNHVSFVAIKNGEHNTLGYFLDTETELGDGRIPLTQVHMELMKSCE